jgi:hypothetical protein
MFRENSWLTKYQRVIKDLVNPEREVVVWMS